jgi:hypothetical protein
MAQKKAQTKHEAAKELLKALPKDETPAKKSKAGEQPADQQMAGDQTAADRPPAQTTEPPRQETPEPRRDDYFDDEAPPVTVGTQSGEALTHPAQAEARPAQTEPPPAQTETPPATKQAQPASAEAQPAAGALPGQHDKPSTPDQTPPAQAVPLEPDVTAPLESEDRMALALRLTSEIKQGLRDALRKLRRVHAEKLWEDLGYTSFGEYVLLALGYTRKWGYQRLTLLGAVEHLEARGVTDPLQHLSPEAALVFRKWQNCPEVFVLAFQQILERGEQPTQARLEHECEVQNDYLHEASQTPDLTQEEYRAYLRLSALPYTFQLDRDFQSPADLLEACRSLKKRPPLKAITQVARGPDLVAVVQQLEPLSAEVARLRELRQQKADLERAKRDLVKDLTEKIRQKDAEIAQVEGDEEGAAEDGDGEGGEDVTRTTTADTTGGTGATAPKPRPHGPSLADLQADPKAFIEDATKRFELTASHPDLVEKAMGDVPALLTRTGTALDTIRRSLDKADDDVKSVEEALREPLD